MNISEIMDKLGDELCSYCPLPLGCQGVHCYGGPVLMCEGSHCEEAFELYIESVIEELDNSFDTLLEKLPAVLSALIKDN